MAAPVPGDEFPRRTHTVSALGALHVWWCRACVMSSEEVGRFPKEVCTESSGTGPEQSFEQDSTLGPEGRRDSIEETEKQSWKHTF